MNETFQAVLHAAEVLFRPGQLVEVRVPNAGRQRTISGYFSDLPKLAKVIEGLERSRYPGLYWTLNPVRLDLSARADHKAQPFAKYTTSDPDILQRRWLPVDFDPERPAGISSTDAEKELAREVYEQAAQGLAAEGWPAPLRADSGNGWHLLYAIDLPNDVESAELLSRVLEGLHARFRTAAVSVDRKNFNASRIFKIYGTTARKGDNTAERPHRLARLLSAPSELVTVSPELLRRVAMWAPTKSAPACTAARSAVGGGVRRGDRRFSVQRFLEQNGIRYRGPAAWNGGRKWVLEECPFDPQHKDPDSAVFELADGSLGFTCLHNSCHGLSWRDFREHFEPGYGDRPVRPGEPPLPEPPPDIALPERASDEGDGCDDGPLSAPDVEAAVDEAIERNDYLGALRLAPEIARLRGALRAVVLAKIRLHFKKEWKAREFDEAMGKTAEEGGAGDEPPAGPIAVGGGDAGLDLVPYPCTDAGNGERIAALFGGDIRYCVEMKKWLRWDGRRWAVDEMGFMRQLGKQMARLLYAQAAAIQKESLREAIEEWARTSESAKGITNALLQAATEKGIPITAAELDKHPYLLNCVNGVVDLITGTLLPHQKDFLITKLCPVKYMPDTICPRFLGFLYWAMGAPTNEDAEVGEHTERLVNFLQRAFGYALTADVSEKAVFVFFGHKGNNGKTTLLNVFRDLLGKDYSGQLVIDTVMSMKQQDATTRADLADLRGLRLVVTSEVEKEHKLNEGKIKYITAGMGEIKSCRKYENPIEFSASHKLFMDCNYRPTVRGVDDAIWRRLKLIPFDVTVSAEERDLQLPDKLRAELEGILAWAVQGCVRWKKEGLGDPPEVSEAGQLWREHDDPLKEFLEDCCEIGDRYFVRCADLGSSYEVWCKRNREKFPLGREAFGERLVSKGFCQSRSRRIDGKQARTWEGVQLNMEAEQEIRRRGTSSSWVTQED